VSPDDRQSGQSARPKRKTASERAEEFDAEQKRLKQEAQERREVAARRRDEEEQQGGRSR
jgi:hypothetical protein